MPSHSADRRLSKYAATSSPDAERPYPRYDSTSQRFWRDNKLAKKFPAGGR